MDEEELLNLVVVERMSWHCHRFRTQYPNEGRDAMGRSEALKKYQKIAEAMPKEVAQEMNDCLDEMTNMLSGDHERYYRAGIEDGIRIDHFIQRVKEKQD